MASTEDDEDIITAIDEDELDDDDEVYHTYGMNLSKQRVGGMVDDEEAVIQAIWKILSTRRYAYLIYDDQYGCDIFNKINDSDLTADYLESDVPAMVEDALLYDERITGISDFSFEILSSDSVAITFTANTIYGDMAIEGVLTDGN